jgi:hypothetical protein
LQNGKNLWTQNITANDRHLRRGVFSGRFFHSGFNRVQASLQLFTFDDTVLMNLLQRNFHQGDNRFLGFGEYLDQLSDTGSLGIDQIIGQHDSKRLVPHQVASA